MGKPVKKTSLYRSGLEYNNAVLLKKNAIAYLYEGFRIPFVQPVKNRTYTPDFALPNGIIIETKGEFDTADRQKHLLVKEQHPLLEIRFVFSNPRQKIYKGSKTTYAMWCEKYGFQWAAKTIPLRWTNEPVFEESLNEIQRLRGKKK